MNETAHSATELWQSFQQLSTHIASRMERDLNRQTGLSSTDFEVLSLLTSQPDRSIRSLALRCELEWEKSRLSHQIRRMEERGLVRRFICETDQRSAEVQVTAEGLERFRNAQKCYEALIQRYVTDVLSEEQMAILCSLSRTWRSELDRADQV